MPVDKGGRRRLIVVGPPPLPDDLRKRVEDYDPRVNTYEQGQALDRSLREWLDKETDQ